MNFLPSAPLCSTEDGLILDARLGGIPFHLLLGEGGINPPFFTYSPNRFFCFGYELRLLPNLWHGQVFTIHTTQKFRRDDSGGLEADEYSLSSLDGASVSASLREYYCWLLQGCLFFIMAHVISLLASVFPHVVFFYSPFTHFSDFLISALSVYGLERLIWSGLFFSSFRLSNIWRTRGCIILFVLIWVAFLLRYMISRWRSG